MKSFPVMVAVVAALMSFDAQAGKCKGSKSSSCGEQQSCGKQKKSKRGSCCGEQQSCCPQQYCPQPYCVQPCPPTYMPPTYSPPVQAIPAPIPGSPTQLPAPEAPGRPPVAPGTLPSPNPGFESPPRPTQLPGQPQPSPGTLPSPGRGGLSADADGLDEVNQHRAARGLRPYIRDPLLTEAAKKCALIKAQNCLSGHLGGPMSDFACLPPGARCSSTGADGSKVRPGEGWFTCCTYENYTTAGAASYIGPDGFRYFSLFVN